MGRWGCVWQKGGCGHRGEGGWAQGRLREGADRGVSAPAGRMAQAGWSSGQGEGAGPPHDPRLDLKDAQPDVALSSPFIFIFTLETSRVIRYNFYTMLKAHQRSVRDPGRRGRGSNIWLSNPRRGRLTCRSIGRLLESLGRKRVSAGNVCVFGGPGRAVSMNSAKSTIW